MNANRNHQRLDVLWREICRLDALVLESERAALELTGTEGDQALASTMATDAKTLLMRALRSYAIESETVRQASRSARAA